MISAFKKVFSLSLVFPLVAFAYQSPGSPTGFVNDFANLLSQQAHATLESKLTAFEKTTGDEIAVVTVKNLGDETVEDFAVALFKEWGIGEKGKDNGILVLVAAEEHKIRIEVGYGLEGDLTDGEASSIIRNIMTPAFRNNDYDGGIQTAVDQIIAAVAPDYASGAGIEIEPISEQSGEGFDFSNIFFFIFFVPIWLGSILSRSKSWWAGGLVGGVIGVVLGFIYGFLYLGLIATIFLIPIGLLFDFLVSRTYTKSTSRGIRPPWWIGGGRIGGGGGGSSFGGFGGGGSGGGGSSGSW
ncbi:MAG: TPM domain-containing protein [Patescibacteria group bacterium]